MLVLLAMVAALGGLYANAAHVGWSDALYLTLVTTLTGQDPDPAKSAPSRSCRWC